MSNLPHDPKPVRELLRTISAEELEAASALLHKEGIAHRLVGTKAGFDIMEIGRAGGPSDKLILVAREDHARASKAMEASYTTTPLPEGHFLRDASDDEILEILAAPEEWSFFDLAHARRLARERQLSAVDLAEKKAVHVEVLQEGRPAPKILLQLGWILACTGSGTGILLGLGIAIATEKTDQGTFPKYDKASRESGSHIAFFSLTMALLLLVLLNTLGQR